MTSYIDEKVGELSAELENPVSLVDLFPTLTDLGGAPADCPGASALAGEGLVPVLESRANARMSDADDRPVLAVYCCEGVLAPMRMVRRGSSTQGAKRKHPRPYVPPIDL